MVEVEPTSQHGHVAMRSGQNVLEAKKLMSSMMVTITHE